MKFGLTDNTIEKINSVFRTFPEIEEAIIYGSRAKGSFREGSDIDITLMGNRLNGNIRSKISIAVDELNTPYLFDISIYQDLNNFELEEHIRKHGKKFFIRNSE